VGHFEVVRQLVAADQQDAVLDRRELVERTADVRREAFAQARGLAQHAVQQRLEPLRVGFGEIVGIAQVRIDFAGVLRALAAAQQPGVHALQRELAGAAARAAGAGARLRRAISGGRLLRRQNLRPRLRRLLRARRSEEHTSELQSRENLVCRLLLEKKKNTTK